MSVAAASGKTDFICAKMNLVNYPDFQKLHPMPSTGTSAQVNTNVSNIQKKRRHSDQYINFLWILDKETRVEEIKPSREVEKPLPPPTNLNITSFDRIPHLDDFATIHYILHAWISWQLFFIVVLKNAGRVIIGVEITLCDNQFLFTLWEDFGEIEGHEIASKMATEADLVVILGRSIGISTYQGCHRRLGTIPHYVFKSSKEPTKHIIYSNNRAKENKTMLLSCPSRKPQQAHLSLHDSHYWRPTTSLYCTNLLKAPSQ
ncbi:hypothetical protein H5410_047637 [Solanum commersonii]|uniref:Uncharacterized protein n=1 Tax=Solanum commersonii TaxID=4109 RepID=A0A9J5XFQ5_SOLCO|nr:hypothetical protein H5410_047637 [Solanum commersonii]